MTPYGGETLVVGALVWNIVPESKMACLHGMSNYMHCFIVFHVRRLPLAVCQFALGRTSTGALLHIYFVFKLFNVNSKV